MRKQLIAITGCAGLAVAGAAAWYTVVPRVEPPPTPSSEISMDDEVQKAVEQALARAQQSPRDPAARLRLALVYDANGLDSMARQTYEQAISMDPENARAWYWLAHVQAQLGRFGDAIDAATRATELDPTYRPARRQIAIWMLREGRIDEAGKWASDALQREPNNPHALVVMGRVLNEQRRYEEAIERLRHALTVDPGYTYAHLLLGTAYRQVGRMDDAAVSTRLGTGSTMAMHDPWNDEVLEHRAGVYGAIAESERLLRSGQATQAVARLESLNRAYPRDVDVLNQLAIAKEMAGRSVEALEILRKAVEIDPQDTMTRLRLSQAYERRSELDRAAAEARQAVALSPDFGTAHRQLARILALQNDLPGAAEALDAAIRHGRREPDMLQLLGEIRINLGDWEAALEAFTQLRAAVPDSADAHLWIALALAEMGRIDRAQPYFQRAEELDPNHPKLNVVRQRLQTLYQVHSGPMPANRQ